VCVCVCVLLYEGRNSSATNLAVSVYCVTLNHSFKYHQLFLFCRNSSTKTCAIQKLSTCLVCCLRSAEAAHAWGMHISPITVHWTTGFVHHEALKVLCTMKLEIKVLCTMKLEINIPMQIICTIVFLSLQLHPLPTKYCTYRIERIRKNLYRRKFIVAIWQHWISEGILGSLWIYTSWTRPVI